MQATLPLMSRSGVAQTVDELDLGALGRSLWRRKRLIGGLTLLAAGLAIGTGLALWAGRAAEKLLFGLKPNDALTFVAAGVLLTVVAVLAGYIPARRASRMDPMNALRVE